MENILFSAAHPCSQIASQVSLAPYAGTDPLSALSCQRLIPGASHSIRMRASVPHAARIHRCLKP
jgi:hypothetical protein